MKMNKKLLSIILVMALTFGPCIMAFATGSTNANATRNSLKSQGNIVYADGDNTVAIYSEDLYDIADKLDTFKMSVASQLAALHTYFTTDDAGVSATTDSNVNITHRVPASTDTVDPLAMDFDTLLEGLAASQSIPTDVTEYGYPADTNLYITDSGTLTTDSTDAAQIGITAATAENLSAGTAAWVNGNLILGTGADNTAYYNKSDHTDIVEIEEFSGSVASGHGSATFNLSNKYSDYKNITIGNIIPQITSSKHNSNGGSTNYRMSWSYDRNTGILTYHPEDCSIYAISAKFYIVLW
jgi:hypothetical protein